MTLVNKTFNFKQTKSFISVKDYVDIRAWKLLQFTICLFKNLSVLQYF